MSREKIKYPVSLGFVRFVNRTSVSANFNTVKRFWGHRRPGKRVMLHARFCINKPIPKRKAK